jgi:hypothetical protein
MAIPTINDDEPIFQPQTVQSGAEGYDEFGHTLGALAESSANEAVRLESTQSRSMMLNSIADSEQVANSARMLMIQHPDQATKIASDTAYTLGTIKDTSSVNDLDRSRMNRYMQTISDGVNLDATRTSVEQAQLGAQFTHYQNWPTMLSTYKQALLTDPDQAQVLHDSMTSYLKGLVDTRVLHPVQAANSLNDMQAVVSLAQDHYSVYGSPNSTAQDLHTATSSPLTNGQPNTGSAPTPPINASTGWATDYFNNDKSFQGVMADIINRKLPNPAAFDSLQPNERQHAMMAINGMRVSDGIINSGEPFPAIQQAFNQLNQKGEILSYQDKATKLGLQNYVNNLTSGNYLNVVQQSPDGNAIFQQFNAKNTAIGNMSASDDQKQQLMLQNKNSMVDQTVAWGQGRKIPDQYIRPIPQADVATAQSAFQNGANPSTLLAVVGQYNKTNQAYLVNSLKSPEQRMVTSAVSLVDQTIKPQDQLDFIAANQQGAIGDANNPAKGRTFFNEKMENATSDKTMMTRIAANLKAPMALVQQMYPDQAQTLQNAMLKTTLNYAKFIAQKNGDYTDSGYKNYVDQASNIYANAYKTQSGSNWMVNSNQLPQPMSNAELDTLADHVTTEGYKYLSQGVPSSQFESAVGRNPLRMVISPTNEVQAVDGNGKIYYSEPFTASTIAVAQASQKARQAQARQQSLGQYEQTVKTQLNVGNLNNANAQ